MKTLKNKSGEIKRAKDSEADRLVTSGVWSFIPKSEWKSFSRPKKVVEKTEE